MKKLILLPILLLSFTITGICQQRKVEKHFNVKKNAQIHLNLKYGDSITVASWPKNEVALKARIKINNGKLNNAFVLHTKKENGQLYITSDFDKEKIKTGRAKDCPDDNYSKYNVSGADTSYYYTICAQISFQVFVPLHTNLKVKTIDSNIKLNNLAGPVRVKAISGDIKLVNLAGPIHAKSISGAVDLSWLPKESARFKLKTISGQIYTNLDRLKINHKMDHATYVGDNVKAHLGENGPVVSLKSISGNVYLRKAKVKT